MTDWLYNSQVSDGIFGGEVLAENTAALYQSISLYPDGISTYTYNVYIRVAAPGAYFSDYSTTVQFHWEFGTESGDFATPSGAMTGFALANFGSFPGGEAYFQAEVPIDTAITGDFTISMSVAGDTDKFLQIREVCINDGFSTFPTGGGGTIQFPTACNRITPPTPGDPVQTWLYFQWQSLDRFFQCDLMILLNKMFTLGNQAMQFAHWQMLYWQSYALSWSRWIGDAVQWANGHVNNLINGRTTTVIAGSQCAGFDLGCLISQGLNLIGELANTLVRPVVDILGRIVDTLLSVITQAANLLFTAINLLLSLFIMLITQMFSLWNQAMSFLQTFTRAWNNVTPQELPLPLYCNDARANAICRTLWVLENTIFSRLGALIIPIAIGGGSILLIIRRVKRIRGAILEMSGGSA